MLFISLSLYHLICHHSCNPHPQATDLILKTNQSQVTTPFQGTNLQPKGQKSEPHLVTNLLLYFQDLVINKMLTRLLTYSTLKFIKPITTSKEKVESKEMKILHVIYELEASNDNHVHLA